MKLIMLGTGNALVTECYNTCFLLEEEGKLFLVDGGGGNEILSQIKKAGYDWMDIHYIFVTHKHIDHLLGIVWMLRMICQFMVHGEYQGDAWIISHKEVIDLLRDLAARLLPKKEADMICRRVHFLEVKNGQTMTLLNRRLTFFDIGSLKARQFGFTLALDEKRKLVCCGDEPLASSLHEIAFQADWLLHEAFCLYSQKDQFDPYEKHHSTVKDACQLASKLEVKNLLLYHTEDQTLKQRKELYQKEGSKFYQGNLLIPDDLEVIELD